jgi:Zn-dependent oligopeptidase
MNPLLDFSGLPRYDAVQSTDVAPAIRQLIAENRALIERLSQPETPATWADFVQPMTDAGERLSRAWGIVGHLHGVNDVPEWREAYNALLPEISGFYADVGQNLALFAKYKALRESPNTRGSPRYASASWTTRCATSASSGAEPAGRPEAALQGDPGRALGPGGEVLGERA